MKLALRWSVPIYSCWQRNYIVQPQSYFSDRLFSWSLIGDWQLLSRGLRFSLASLKINKTFSLFFFFPKSSGCSGYYSLHSWRTWYIFWNQSSPGVRQSAIFGKLIIGLAIITCQKKVSLGADESRSVPWCGSRLFLVLCAWFTKGKYAIAQKNLKSLSKSDWILPASLAACSNTMYFFTWILILVAFNSFWYKPLILCFSKPDGVL